MDSKQLEKRKKVLLDLMNDKIYVPMKIKELAIILQVSKEERPDLELVMKNFWQRARLKSPKEASIKLQKKRRLPEPL